MLRQRAGRVDEYGKCRKKLERNWGTEKDGDKQRMEVKSGSTEYDACQNSEAYSVSF